MGLNFDSSHVIARSDFSGHLSDSATQWASRFLDDRCHACMVEESPDTAGQRAS